MCVLVFNNFLPFKTKVESLSLKVKTDIAFLQEESLLSWNHTEVQAHDPTLSICEMYKIKCVVTAHLS